jgi:hypothetical protein
MLTFLQYVGGFILAIIILLFLGYLYLKLKFGKLLGADSDQVPLMIHLNEDLVTPDWLGKSKAIEIIEKLESLGFTKGKAYRILEMNGVSLFSLFNKGYCAVIYSHPVVGFWTDIVFETPDGFHYTASNAAMGGEIITSPKDIKFSEPQASVEELVDWIRKQAQDNQAIPVNNDSFRDFFENAYKREMAWKASQGGVTREEFDEIGKNAKIKITESNSEKAFIEAKLLELEDWNNYGIVEFYKDKEKEEYDGNLFIVPEKSYSCAFIHFMADQEMIESEQIDKLCDVLKDESVSKIFEKLNLSLSPEVRAHKIGAVNYPVKADVYLKKWD